MYQASGRREPPENWQNRSGISQSQLHWSSVRAMPPNRRRTVETSRGDVKNLVDVLHQDPGECLYDATTSRKVLQDTTLIRTELLHFDSRFVTVSNCDLWPASCSVSTSANSRAWLHNSATQTNERVHELSEELENHLMSKCNIPKAKESLFVYASRNPELPMSLTMWKRVKHYSSRQKHYCKPSSLSIV